MSNVAEALVSLRSQRPVGGVSKRSLDLTSAVILIVMFVPLLVLISLAVLVLSRDWPIFAHRRIGFRGSEFYCLKFRSMAHNSEAVLRAHLERDAAAAAEWAETQKLKWDPRITPIGRVLRATSLDELPQLINVIRGEMSLVGPRPVVASEAERFGSDFEYYKLARPGITGSWQVNGRSSCTYPERVQLDSTYVKTWSMRQDLRILLRTTKVVLSREGSY